MEKKFLFKEVSAKIDFPILEERILKFWQANHIFEKSVKQRSNKKTYSFYDGPPFITGLPHYGHLLGSIAKDLIPRYQTMKGKKVRRVWGWDCHGLPVEEKTEKKLGLKNRRDIEKIGIDTFIKACRSYVSEVSAEWKWYIDHIGRWVDLENAYRTMDLKFMESVIWAFKQLYDQGLIYPGLKTLLYCTRCGTPISKFEIAMDDSYTEMEDPAVIVEFPIITPGEFIRKKVLAWTTTPWTLPSNRALVIDPKETYLEFRKAGDDDVFIIAEKRIKKTLLVDKYRVLRKFKGERLIGLNYQPLYHYFPPNKNDFKIYSYAEMVNMEEGTGIVHSSPGFGEIDSEMGQHFGLTMMFAVDEEGKFINQVTNFKGIYVKEADPLIIADLQKRGFLFRAEKIVHRYPYCYRCETPLIYKAVKAWFINIQKIKKEMLSLNKEINWVPPHFKDRRVKNTISEAPDWCVSRTRYWATVMPIWKCENCQSLKVVGSIKEIEENSIEKVRITDLHRTGVDQIIFKCQECGRRMKRIPEVLDCWFESGSMPYGERHYPFENKIEFEHLFPADYIVEYVGQIRAWFYYLHALSTALFHSNSFKNVVVTGVMAGTDGRKMSKTYGNYPDPREMLTQYGGDALRLYLMGTKLMIGEDANITRGEELLNQVRNILLPLWNSYKFWVTFANLNQYRPGKKVQKTALLNRWIFARSKQLVNEIDNSLDHYYIPRAVKAIRPFLEDLSDWYIRRSRENFSEGNQEFLETLYQVLNLFIKATAPIIPFVTEEIYQNLNFEKVKSKKESVHLCLFPPKLKLSLSEKKLIKEMKIAREITSLALSIRKKKNLKVRQPLARLTYYWSKKLSRDLERLIAEEINVKQLLWKKKEIETPQVRLVTRLSKELIVEGKARELVRKIQELRKEKKCHLNEKIIVFSPEIPKEKSLIQLVKRKTLAKKILPGPKLMIQIK